MIDLETLLGLCVFAGGIYRYRTYYRLGASIATGAEPVDKRILADGASPISIRVDSAGNVRIVVV